MTFIERIFDKKRPPLQQIEDLEKALLLYKKVKDNFSEYLPQLFSAVALIVNKNFEEPTATQAFQEVDDDDLPF